MKQRGYWLQFLIACVTVVLLAGHPGYSSIASPAIGAANIKTADAVQLSQLSQTLPSNSPSRPDIDALLQRINQVCPADLEAAIDRIIRSSTFAESQWGIQVATLPDRTILYSHNADQFLIPASNIKLLTTAAALQRDASDPQWHFSNLEQWIRVINRDSDNDYADALLDRIGGTRSVQQVLGALGIDPAHYRQVDGSGLSRYNVAQPAAFITLLSAMDSAAGNQIFYDSLPVAGMSGTLSDRFRGTAVQGRVHAKTGTLRGVKALSGYLEHPDYERLVFSIIVNQPGQSGQVLMNAIDRIVLQLNQLAKCDAL